MHPIIERDVMHARVADLHRQAKQSTPFTPAHTIAELTCRALTLLRARRALASALTAVGKHWQPPA
jgi:hypothetical protein